MTNTTLPRKIFELNKAVAESTIANLTAAAQTIGRSIATTIDASRTAGKTVVGQTRSVVERTAATTAAGAREIAGQAEAQGARVGKTASREANRIVDRAARRVADKPSVGTPYEQWTKAQLLERAREVELDGRATMSKGELVAALRG